MAFLPFLPEDNALETGLGSSSLSSVTSVAGNVSALRLLLQTPAGAPSGAVAAVGSLFAADSDGAVFLRSYLRYRRRPYERSTADGHVADSALHELDSLVATALSALSAAQGKSTAASLSGFPGLLDVIDVAAVFGAANPKFTRSILDAGFAASKPLTTQLPAALGAAARVLISNIPGALVEAAAAAASPSASPAAVLAQVADVARFLADAAFGLASLLQFSADAAYALMPAGDVASAEQLLRMEDSTTGAGGVGAIRALIATAEVTVPVAAALLLAAEKRCVAAAADTDSDSDSSDDDTTAPAAGADGHTKSGAVADVVPVVAEATRLLAVAAAACAAGVQAVLQTCYFDAILCQAVETPSSGAASTASTGGGARAGASTKSGAPSASPAAAAAPPPYVERTARRPALMREMAADPMHVAQQLLSVITGLISHEPVCPFARLAAAAAPGADGPASVTAAAAAASAGGAGRPTPPAIASVLAQLRGACRGAGVRNCFFRHFAAATGLEAALTRVLAARARPVTAGGMAPVPVPIIEATQAAYALSVVKAALSSPRVPSLSAAAGLAESAASAGPASEADVAAVAAILPESSRDAILRALQLSGNRVDAAVDRLLSQGGAGGADEGLSGVTPGADLPDDDEDGEGGGGEWAQRKAFPALSTAFPPLAGSETVSCTAGLARQGSATSAGSYRSRVAASTRRALDAGMYAPEGGAAGSGLARSGSAGSSGGGSVGAAELKRRTLELAQRQLEEEDDAAAAAAAAAARYGLVPDGKGAFVRAPPGAEAPAALYPAPSAGRGGRGGKAGKAGKTPAAAAVAPAPSGRVTTLEVDDEYGVLAALDVSAVGGGGGRGGGGADGWGGGGRSGGIGYDDDYDDAFAEADHLGGKDAGQTREWGAREDRAAAAAGGGGDEVTGHGPRARGGVSERDAEFRRENKARFGNHDRKRGADKKMAKGMS